MLGSARRLGAIALAIVMLLASASAPALGAHAPHDKKASGKSSSAKPFGSGVGRRNH